MILMIFTILAISGPTGLAAAARKPSFARGRPPPWLRETKRNRHNVKQKRCQMCNRVASDTLFRAACATVPHATVPVSAVSALCTFSGSCTLCTVYFVSAAGLWPKAYTLLWESPLNKSFVLGNSFGIFQNIL